MIEPSAPIADCRSRGGCPSRRAEPRSVWAEDRAPSVVVFDGTQTRWGRLRDLSSKGVGLALGHCPPAGSALVVSLRCGAGTLDVDRAARVLHVTAEAAGTWRVGCAFTRPLSDDELVLVLAAAGQRAW